MAQNSKIEWTTHTFNPWRGCSKLSAGCQNCYALDLSKRNPGTLGVWGPSGTRIVASEEMWKQPVKWNRAAQEAGERHRVFCASLADVFEGRDTMPEASWEAIEAARLRLLDLIRQTPHLDWLLLTKRPQHVLGQLEVAMMRAANRANDELEMWLQSWVYEGKPPKNVWMGTSVEDQKTADERITELLKVPAALYFLSCEPLLAPLELLRTPRPNLGLGDANNWLTWNQRVMDGKFTRATYNRINWVICGGESGPNARPMHPDWARSLRDQCVEAKVSYFFKQHGEWREPSEGEEYDTSKGRMAKRPAFIVSQDGTVHCFRGDTIINGKVMLRTGKKAAGRLLDGRTWDETPEVTP